MIGARNALPWLRDPYGFLARAAAEEGRYTFVRELPVLGRTLLTGAPEVIGEIVHHPDLDAGAAVVGLRRILGEDSLIMLDGEAHAERKQLVAPCLRGEALDRYDAMLHRVAEQHARALPERFSGHAWVHGVSLDAIARVMFGERPEVVETSRRLVERFLGSFRSPLPLFVPALQRDWGRWSAWGRALRSREALEGWCLERIPRGEGLAAELAARAGGERPEALVTEVLALLMFGHDTGAAQMAWALAHLHQHGAAERARDDPDWLDACLRESMRLCPVVPHLTRVARRPVRIGDVDVARGERVAPSAWLAQHNPALWPEPERFDPDRFAGTIPKHAWFPFGFGARTCVGMAFATRQAQIVIGTLLREARLSLAPGYCPTPRRQLVLVVPSGGCPMRVLSRHERDSTRS